MRKMLLLVISLILALLQTAVAQDTLVQNLGAGHIEFDQLMLYAWNQKDGHFYIGSCPNGHLNVYNPLTNQIKYIKYTRPSDPPGLLAENYSWTVSSDTFSQAETYGYIYGGTCQGWPAYIYAYDSSADQWTYKSLGDYGANFVWSSAITDNFAYFGVESGERGRLIKWDKNNPDIYYDVFDSLYRDSLNLDFPPFSQGFVNHRCPELMTFLNEHSAGSYPGEMKVRCLTAGPEGMIYGGTENGFVFAYKPGVDTLIFVNLNEAIFPGESDIWGPAGITFLEGNGDKVFGSVLGNDSIGTFEVDFSESPLFDFR